MEDSKHVSPISFEASPSATESRGGWEVVLTYEGESNASGLVDLSHWPKWDIQDKLLSRIELSGIRVPDQPGGVYIEDNLLINRMNATQAAIWQYQGQAQQWPNLQALTDVTDAFALITLYGKETGRIMEKVTTLDLGQPDKDSLFLLQGPCTSCAHASDGDEKRERPADRFDGFCLGVWSSRSRCLAGCGRGVRSQTGG